MPWAKETRGNLEWEPKSLLSQNRPSYRHLSLNILISKMHVVGAITRWSYQVPHIHHWLGVTTKIDGLFHLVDGNVYSFGWNQYGELGLYIFIHGSKWTEYYLSSFFWFLSYQGLGIPAKKKFTPTLIPYFRDNKIEVKQISCGMFCAEFMMSVSLP
jgi:hypothetical protein